MLSSDRPMLGRGVGTNGAGGPGILQTLGSVAGALSWLPSVTGVFGGLTATLMPIAVGSHRKMQYSCAAVAALGTGPKHRARTARIAAHARCNRQHREQWARRRAQVAPAVGRRHVVQDVHERRLCAQHGEGELFATIPLAIQVTVARVDPFFG